MITDGTVYCGLCGEDRVGCYLCGKAPLVGRVGRSWREEREAEKELLLQSKSIRLAAEKGGE
jgi:hypothetical protein